MIRRRDFITEIAGSAVVWPLAARAQQGERIRRIGVINAINVDDPEWQTRVAAFHQGLQEAGWIVGRNVRID
jgi:putative ABC transport system substrate-binding protein